MIKQKRSAFRPVMPVTQKGSRHTVSVDRKQLSSTIPILIDHTLFGAVQTRNTTYLDVTLPTGQSFRTALSQGDVNIGREEGCQLHIPLHSVSRHHARIFFDGDEYTLEDLDSTNGTFVNGIRVSRCKLRNGDQMRIGDALVVFVRQKSRDE